MNLRHMPALAMAMLAFAVCAAPPATAKDTGAAAAEVCAITGRVQDMQQVRKSFWNDGAPSLLAETETRISVLVENRFPHAQDAAGPRCAGTGQKVTYKLCSPTPVKTGDRIQGTEGTQTIGMGCLFDLVVLPQT